MAKYDIDTVPNVTRDDQSERASTRTKSLTFAPRLNRVGGTRGTPAASNGTERSLACVRAACRSSHYRQITDTAIRNTATESNLQHVADIYEYCGQCLLLLRQLGLGKGSVCSCEMLLTSCDLQLASLERRSFSSSAFASSLNMIRVIHHCRHVRARHVVEGKSRLL